MGQGDRSGGEAKRAANEARQEERRRNKKGRPMRRGERSGVEAKRGSRLGGERGAAAKAREAADEVVWRRSPSYRHHHPVRKVNFFLPM